MDIKFSFDKLVESTRSIHNATAGWAKSAVNQSLTVRNWMIGCYIVEYEQNGNDRAEYGVRLLENLAERLSIKGLDRTMLNLCRMFYLRYSQLNEAVWHRVKKISKSGEAFLLMPAVMDDEKKGDIRICETVSHKFKTEPNFLLSHLSFSHEERAKDGGVCFIWDG